jgi:cyclase
VSDYRLEELAPGVYARLGRGPIQPNCAFIVGDESVLVFDSSYSPAAGRAIVADIARVTSKPISTLVVSHHHWDHAWGAQSFASALIVSHVGARDALLARAQLQLASLRTQPARPASWMEISPEQLVRELDELRATPATLTYTESATFWSGGREIQLRHFGAAHTYGDTLVWLPRERLLFGGDVVCNRLIPVVGDGDPLHFAEVLDEVVALQPKTVVPGHGGLASAHDVREFQSCLRALCDEVQAARHDGAPDATAALERVRLNDFEDWAGRDILPGSVRRIWEVLASL